MPNSVQSSGASLSFRFKQVNDDETLEVPASSSTKLDHLTSKPRKRGTFLSHLRITFSTSLSYLIARKESGSLTMPATSHQSLTTLDSSSINPRPMSTGSQTTAYFGAPQMPSLPLYNTSSEMTPPHACAAQKNGQVMDHSNTQNPSIDNLTSSIEPPLSNVYAKLRNEALSSIDLDALNEWIQGPSALSVDTKGESKNPGRDSHDMAQTQAEEVSTHPNQSTSNLEQSVGDWSAPEIRVQYPPLDPSLSKQQYDEESRSRDIPSMCPLCIMPLSLTISDIWLHFYRDCQFDKLPFEEADFEPLKRRKVAMRGEILKRDAGFQRKCPICTRDRKGPHVKLKTLRTWTTHFMGIHAGILSHPVCGKCSMIFGSEEERERHNEDKGSICGSCNSFIECRQALHVCGMPDWRKDDDRGR